MRLIIVRGLPGSGKTSFVKRSFTNILHVEADMFTMVNGKYEFDTNKLKERHAMSLAVTSLAICNGADAVVANTFSTLKEMEPYIRMAKNNKAEIIVYKMSGNYKSLHNVPSEVIEKMKERWEDYEGELCPHNP